LLSGLIVAFVIGEVILRIVYLPDVDPATAVIHRRASDDDLIYELVPGAETTRHGVHIRINADGFRDDPFPPTRSPDEYRLLILGDSVTSGFRVAMNDVFPQLLERDLNAQGEGDDRSYVVFNLGVYGYATAQELRLLETRGLDLDPDLIVLAYVLNDPDLADGGQARYFARPPLVMVQLVRDVARLIAAKRSGAEYHHWIHERHAKEVEDQFRRMGAIQRRTGVPILVVLIPAFSWGETYPWVDLNLRLKRLATEHGLRFLDLWTSLGRHSPQDVGMDIWHPNERGHRIIADALADEVRAFMGGTMSED